MDGRGLKLYSLYSPRSHGNRAPVRHGRARIETCPASAVAAFEHVRPSAMDGRGLKP